MYIELFCNCVVYAEREKANPQKAFKNLVFSPQVCGNCAICR